MSAFMPLLELLLAVV